MYFCIESEGRNGSSSSQSFYNKSNNKFLIRSKNTVGLGLYLILNTTRRTPFGSISTSLTLILIIEAKKGISLRLGHYRGKQKGW